MVVRIVGLAEGGSTAFEGEYVAEYDPGRNGAEPGGGRLMTCHLVTTPDRALALDLPLYEALELWRSVDPRSPVRPDGAPNRPMTAFTVEIMA